MYKLRNKYIYRDIEKEREREEIEREKKREKKEKHFHKDYHSKFGKSKNIIINNNNINDNIKSRCRSNILSMSKKQHCYVSNNSSSNNNNNDEMPYHNISSVTSEMKCTDDHLDKNNNGDNFFSRQHSCIMFSKPLEPLSPSSSDKMSFRKIYNNNIITNDNDHKPQCLKFCNDININNNINKSSSSETETSLEESNKSSLVYTDIQDINKCMEPCFEYTDYIDESENVSNETVIITKSPLKEDSDNRFQYKFADVNDENYLYVNFK